MHGRQQGGTWLLPMGYPEGSPTHPAYPAGHSCFVAAAATIAKAYFKDSVLPKCVMVNPDDRAGALSTIPCHVPHSQHLDMQTDVLLPKTTP